MRAKQAVLAGIAAGTLLAASLHSPIQADNGTDSTSLRAAVGAAGIGSHLTQFQAIADANGGTRAAGTAGDDASVAYVKGQLESAGYTVTLQPFSYDKFIEVSPDTLAQATPTATPYVYGEDFFTMDYSGSGRASGAVTPVDVTFRVKADRSAPPITSANSPRSTSNATPPT